MFLGNYRQKFSGRGRILLPSRFRDELNGELRIVLSRGMDGCIWGFSLRGWEYEAGKRIEVPVTEKEGRDLRRYFFSAAVEVEVDKQGRIVVPKDLLKYAKIRNQVELIGAGDHFEIWNSKVWNRYQKSLNI